MKTLKLFFLISAFSSTSILSGQNKFVNYDHIVFKVTGDLNNDGLSDKVLVKVDKNDKYLPNLLIVQFQNKEGNYKTVLSSTKAVLPKFTSNGGTSEATLEKLEIKNGILTFTNQLIRGSFSHKFRFQKGNFELIGFQSNNANAGYIESIDYNLSTGDKIVKHTDYETDKIIKQIKTKDKISPLPKLQDFTPFDFTY